MIKRPRKHGAFLIPGRRVRVVGLCKGFCCILGCINGDTQPLMDVSMQTSQYRALMIEDSHTQAKIMKKILDSCHCEILHIASAQDFKHVGQLEAFTPQIVFLDVHLRDAMGMDLISPIKSNWPDAIIVMMTSQSRDDYAVLVEAREQGADLVIRKPFNFGEAKALFRDIESLMNTGERLCHLVVIDDSVTVCQAVAQMAAAEGFRVTAFTHPEEAVQRLSYDQVDVVLTDLNMPGMSGVELINLVRDLWPGVGVIAMSSAGADCEPERVDAYLVKPFSRDALVDAVQSARNDGRKASDDLFYL